MGRPMMFRNFIPFPEDSPAYKEEYYKRKSFKYSVAILNKSVLTTLIYCKLLYLFGETLPVPWFDKKSIYAIFNLLRNSSCISSNNWNSSFHSLENNPRKPPCHLGDVKYTRL